MQKRNLIVVSMMVLVVLASACSGSSSPSPSASPSADAYCAQVQAVKDSFNALVGTDIVSEGTDTLKTRFDAFTADLTSLKTSSSEEFSTEFDAVQTSVDQLKTVVDDADSAGVAKTAAQFLVGLGSLKTTVTALFTAVDQKCGG